MIRFPGENLWEVIHSLFDKVEQTDADFSAEITALEESLARQQSYAAQIDGQLDQDLASITAKLSEIAA